MIDIIKNITIKKEEILGFNKELLDEYKKKYSYNYSECPKLIPNLRNKKNYTCHIRNL